MARIFTVRDEGFQLQPDLSLPCYPSACRRCGTAWRRGILAMSVGQSIIYLEDGPPVPVNVFHRTCGGQGCDCKLPFDGSEYGLLNQNNRELFSWSPAALVR